MLKLIHSLVVCLVIVVTGAYAPPTYAASAPIVISHIQAGGVGAPTEELVAIYNNSNMLEEVDITNWCLKNKNNVTIACFGYPGSTDRMILKVHGYATAGTSVLASVLWEEPTITYAPANQSSGSITNSGDTISLYDSSGMLIDSYSWSGGLPTGDAWTRKMREDELLTYVDTDSASDWMLTNVASLPREWVVRREAGPDLCPNLEGIQDELPVDYVLNEEGTCDMQFDALHITELFPNPSGADAGKEFIELYNPNEKPVELANYVLWVGPNFEKSYVFPVDTIIPPQSYIVFDNITIPYSLANTSSRVRLTTTQGTIVSETPLYEKPKDNFSWALVEGEWQYTHQPTPGTQNQASIIPDPNPSLKTTSPKPCAANQYRSPETHRCRLIATASKSPTACQPGSYRHPETGRCRKLTTSQGPAACKEGQERNPETNRCRTIKKLETVDYGVLGTETKKEAINWYFWATVGGVLLLAVGYAVWEWRTEINKILGRIVGFVRTRK